MTASPTATPGRYRRRILALGIVVLVAIVAWTVAWYWLAGRLESEARALLAPPDGQGAVTCTPGKATGFPFRIDLGCTDLVATDPAFGTLRIPAIAATSFVYRPDHVIAEFAQPMTLTPAAGPPVVVGWHQAFLGGHWRPQAVDSADLSVTDPAVTVGGTAVGGAAAFEVHVRRTPDEAGGTDVAFSADKAVVTGASLPPLDLAVVATVRDSGALIDGRGFTMTDPEGLTVRVDKLSFGDGTHSLVARGKLQLRPDGLLDGDLDVALGDPVAFAGLLQRLGVSGSLPQTLSGAAAMFGRTDAGGTTVTLAIKRGRAAIGVVPLFAIPPIALPGAVQG